MQVVFLAVPLIGRTTPTSQASGGRIRKNRRMRPAIGSEVQLHSELNLPRVIRLRANEPKLRVLEMGAGKTKLRSTIQPEAALTTSNADDLDKLVLMMFQLRARLVIIPGSP